MPQVVAAAAMYVTGSTAAVAATATTAAVAATGLGTVAFAGITYATLIGYAVTIGASIAYSTSQNAKLRNSLKGVSDTGRNVMARDPLANQRGVYGQIPLAGPVVFMHTTGAKNEYLHAVEVIAGHECGELGTVYFDETDGMVEVPLDGAGNATGKYAGYFICKKHLGTNTQTADATLVAAAGAHWTANHRLRGNAYLYLQFIYNADLYPNGMPTVRVMTKGKLLMDPRVGIYSVPCDMEAGNTHVGCTDTSDLAVGMRVQGYGIVEGTRIVSIDGSGTFFTVDTAPFLDNAAATLSCGVVAWSANSALCAADYLTDCKLGRAVPWERVRQDVLSAEANVCEETIVTDDGTEPRYETHGAYTSDQDAMSDLLSAMAGRIVDTGGLWSILAGYYRTPVTGADFTDGDLLGALSVQPRQSMRDSYSGVRGTYISAKNNWQASDFPKVKNDEYARQDGNRRRWKDVAYPFVVSSSQSQRLAKSDLERGRQQIVFQALYRPKAFRVACGETIRVTSDVLGWANKVFEVISWSLRVVNNALGILVTGRETASGVWDWADGEETTVDLAPNTTLPTASTKPAAPASVTLTANVAYVADDGTVTPRIRVQWPTPNNIYVESGGRIDIEYKENGTGTWLPWSPARGDTLEDYIFGVKSGLYYDVRVRYVTEIGVRSNWTSATTPSAVAGDPNAPAAPASLTATPKPGLISLSWPPSTNNAVNEYIIERSITSAVAGFALLTNAFVNQYDDYSVVAGTTYWYRVRAVTVSENQSANVVSAGVIALNPAVGAAVPGNPTACTDLGTNGTYLADDGSVFAYGTFRIPALPTNALSQNLLYRRNGSSEWLSAAQLQNVGNADVTLDDLSPGVAYQIATQAWSPAGGSAVVAMSSGGGVHTAAVRGDIPPTPTGGSLSSNGVVPKYLGTTPMYGCMVAWDPTAESDFSHYEVKATLTDTDGAVDYSWTEADQVNFWARVTRANVILYSFTLGAGYVRVRQVNRSGVASAWLRIGNANGSATAAVGNAAVRNVGTSSGTVSAGDDSRITGAAQKSANLSDVASAATARTNLGLGTADNPDFDGLRIQGDQLLSARKAAVTAALDDANESLVTGDFSGGDTASLAALVAYFNAVDARLNNHADRINDIRNRLKATGGHGLIDD